MLPGPCGKKHFRLSNWIGGFTPYHFPAVIQSFNAVINCWAQSKMTGAAHRATAILKHMMKRYDANNTIVAPDSASYTTVINAWARSRERDAIERAEEIFQLCEESFQRGNQRAKPNALTYNSLINCYSKFNDGHASKKAIELLETMKERSRTEEHEDCHPDVITYTSVMDALAKRQSVEAAAKAEALLEELENAHRNAPGDQRLKPNVRAYTSVGRTKLLDEMYSFWSRRRLTCTSYFQR